MIDSLASVDHTPVAGSHNSATFTANASLVPANAFSVVPPLAITLPSARRVALNWRRTLLIEPVADQVGLAWFRSMVSAVATGGWQPPTYRILPGAYCTAEP